MSSETFKINKLLFGQHAGRKHHQSKNDLLMYELYGMVKSLASTWRHLLSFSRAAQKLNLSSKRKKHQPSLLHPQEPSIYPTNFSGILQVSPPPTPPCLLRAVSKVKENPGMGKVSSDLYQYTTNVSELVKYRAWIQTHTGCAHLSPITPTQHTPIQPHTHKHTDTHRPLFVENAGWRHTGPLAACCLVQSMQM